MTVYKQCPVCKEFLDAQKWFYPDVSKKDTFQSHCKDCRREYSGSWVAQWRREHPAEYKQKTRRDTEAAARQRKGNVQTITFPNVEALRAAGKANDEEK